MHSHSFSESVAPAGAITVEPEAGGAPVSRTGSLHTHILRGSAILVSGSVLVSALDFVYNIAIARMLGAAGFGHAALLYTLLMLLSSVQLSFQLVCAKFVAHNESAGAKAATYQNLLRRAWRMSLLIGGVIAAASIPLSQYLRLPSPALIMLLGAAVTFHVPLGVRRGAMQGVCAFRRLAFSLALESLCRLTGAVLLVKAGFGVFGVALTIAGSVMVAYFASNPGKRFSAPSAIESRASFGEGMQAILFFAGQVLLNNVDIVLVKHFFAAGDAGLYAAVALVGRVVYLFSWSVVSAMFPLSARGETSERPHRVLLTPILLVTAMTLAFVLGLALIPEWLWTAVLGSRFHATGMPTALLEWYAMATGIYALAVVVMGYEMSRRISYGVWLQLAFGVGLIAAVHFLHASLLQVIGAKALLMAALLAVVSLPFRRFPAICRSVVARTPEC